MVEPDAKAQAFELLQSMAGASGDLGSMDDALPVLTTFLAEFAAPDFVCRMIGRPPMSDVEHPGVEGLATAWHDWGEAFKTVRIALGEVRQSENHVVLLVEQIAVTRHDAVEIRQPSAMLWRFDDEHVTALEFHLDRERALRDAGIDVGSPRSP